MEPKTCSNCPPKPRGFVGSQTFHLECPHCGKVTHREVHFSALDEADGWFIEFCLGCRQMYRVFTIEVAFQTFSAEELLMVEPAF